MSFGGDASRGRGHPARTGTSVPGRDLYPLPGGHSAPTETGILSPTASNAPAGVAGARSRRMSPAGVAGARTRRMSPASSNASGGVGRPCGLCRPRSRTYFSVGDCVLPPEVTTGPQSFGEKYVLGGERSPRWAGSAVRRRRRDWSEPATSVLVRLADMGCVARRAGSAVRRRRRDRSGQVRDGRHNLMVASTTGGGACIDCQDRPARLPGGISTAGTGARCPRWARLPVPGCSGIGFAPWLQDDASTPTPALRPCASGPRSRTRSAMERPTPLKDLPALKESPVALPPLVPPTGPPDVG